jgi:hypothetical protein
MQLGVGAARRAVHGAELVMRPVDGKSLSTVGYRVVGGVTGS